ncbi:MAG TPA: cytidylate kinase-like family protein [Rhodospirillaceae bacterium]|nr:cytidylate kinase-like family protein [Rhodospirillaceae bacterium]
MTPNVLSVISAMAEVVMSKPEGTLALPLKPVVTISRDYGSGGDVIATRLAQRLGVDLFDEQILKQIAQRLHEDPVTVKLIDESVGRAKDLWFYRLFSGKEVGIDSYRDTLVKVVMSLGRLGGVIIGRGAHVILSDACALRVRIAGSVEICAERMVQGHHDDLAKEIEKAKDINHRRGKFVWEVFHSRLSDAHQFDVSVNTDRMDDFEDVVEMLQGMAGAIHSGRVLRKT